MLFDKRERFLFLRFYSLQLLMAHKYVKRRRPISGHLDREKLVNYGFTKWAKEGDKAGKIDPSCLLG